MWQIVLVAFHILYSNVDLAYMPYAPQVHAYKAAFNEALSNAGIVMCITYAILTGSVELSKVLCLYKA